MVNLFNSPITTELEADEGIHEEPTSISQGRQARTLLDRFETDEFRKAKEQALRNESSERYHNQFVHIASSIDAFWDFIREADDEQVFSFLEYLLTYVHNERTPNRQKELTATYPQIKDIFGLEGMLYELCSWGRRIQN